MMWQAKANLSCLADTRLLSNTLHCRAQLILGYCLRAAEPRGTAMTCTAVPAGSSNHR